MACLIRAGAENPPFILHAPPVELRESLRGAALVDRATLVTWGDRLLEWTLPQLRMRSLASAGGGFGDGGCIADVDQDGRADLIAQEQTGIGRLVWRQAPEFRARLIDTGIEMHDCAAATLHGRRGVLVVQRYTQVRFYQIPETAAERWPYREIYSIYTASRQGGLLVADVDGDGRHDILCGNYWMRNPDAFELPWRLFAVNLHYEHADSATARIALVRSRAGGPLDELVFAQGELARTRLRLLRKPDDPTGLWRERTAGPQLRAPHGLAVADFDGDGRVDIAVGENHDSRSRLLVFENRGAGRYRARTVATGWPASAVEAADLNGDGAPDLIVAGAAGVAWWENRYRRR